MSDWPQGPGWWQASDGKWYAPERRPAPMEPVRRGVAPVAVITSILVALVLATSVAAIVLREDGGLRLTAADEPAADPAQPDIQAPDGYKLVGGDEAGFTMAIPERYESFDLTTDDFEDISEFLGPDNPELAEMLELTGPVLEQGGRLMAFDTTTARSGFADNVNVIEQPAVFDPTSPGYQRQIESAFESFGATVHESAVVELPVGEAFRMEYTLPINLPGGTTINASGRQVALSVGGHIWQITHTTGPDTGDEDFEVMLDSFRVTG